MAVFERTLGAFAHATRFWSAIQSPSHCIGRRDAGSILIRSPGYTRTVKTRSTISLSDLPQGQLPSLPSLSTDEKTSKDDEAAHGYPTVIQQHLNNVRKFKDCVVLTRVGNFYELYAEQAEQYAPLLNLKVAQRKTKVMGSVAMAGFQYQFLERYLKQLVCDLNTHVAISEEHAKSVESQAKGNQLLYDRKVSRVVTAGTLIDESFMDPFENNFILSVDIEHTNDPPGSETDASMPPEAVVGLCWADLSSGQLYVQSTAMSSLASVIARIAPREIVLDTALRDSSGASDKLRESLGELSFGMAYHRLPHGPTESIQAWNELLDEPFDVASLHMTPHETKAGSMLLSYVKDKMQSLKITFRSPTRHSDNEYMQVDKQSLRGLEVRATLRDNLFQGSLLHSIRRTLTKGGTRLLTQRLVSPLMSIQQINIRLDLVSTLLASDILREDLATMLKQTADVQRLLQKFSIGRGDADDLLALAKTISIVARLRHVVARALNNIATDGVDSAQEAAMRTSIVELPVDDVIRVRDKIHDAIDEDGLSRQHHLEDQEATVVADFAADVESADGVVKTKRPRKVLVDQDVLEDMADNGDGDVWIMKKDASTNLKRLHKELITLIKDKAELGHDLRRSTNSNSLTLRWTAQLGHYCHVKGKDCKIDMPGVRIIQSTKSTRAFYLSDWTELGRRIDQNKLRIRTEEQKVFSNLRNEVITSLIKLRQIATTLDELDVAYSSATLAKERRLVRPSFHSGQDHLIVGGRHPMVDLGLLDHGRHFTSNDCEMNADQQRVLLITGPNMAGKSTYLRQTALISILAQTGCFVPAEYARLSIVDKVFSRIGSADNLYKHQSTFMVEMLEVASILHNATSRSLVMMDEVGRGTTPEDGAAVAYACLKYLHDVNQCKTLFATHFHVLADMTADLPGVANRCSDVVEGRDGSWIYMHKIRNGVNRDSHALKVAKLAGLPGAVTELAERSRSAFKSRQKYQPSDLGRNRRSLPNVGLSDHPSTNPAGLSFTAKYADSGSAQTDHCVSV